jgi:glycosyltransferase involved in cell wall biosynthesis
MGHAGITFGMINRDGGETLRDCLQSVAHLVDEMIVVDTGSTDDSPAVAHSFGATVLFRDWPDDFSVARNVYISAARQPFILSLDSDEVIAPCTREELDDLLTATPQSGFLFKVYNYFRVEDFDRTLTPNELTCKPLDGLGISPSYTVRLFPRLPGVRYCYPVHELVSPSLVQYGIGIRVAPWRIHHLGFVTGRGRVPIKRRYYRELGYRKIALHPDCFRGYFELAKLLSAGDEIEEARALLERCLALAPRFVDGHRHAALLALRAKDWSGCARHIRRGFRLERGNLDLLYVYGLFEMKSGRPDRAEDCFSAVVAKHPKHIPSRIHLADLLIKRGDYETAENILKAVLRVQPARADVRLLLAEIAERQGYTERLDEILKEALRHPGAAHELRAAAVATRSERIR